MTEKTEALQMADHLESRGLLEEAAELRRLHAENEALRNAANRGGHLAVAQQMIDELEAQRDALLKTLKWLDRWMGSKPMTECSAKVLAAIKAVEGETK